MKNNKTGSWEEGGPRSWGRIPQRAIYHLRRVLRELRHGNIWERTVGSASADADEAGCVDGKGAVDEVVQGRRDGVREAVDGQVHITEGRGAR